eukprot:scaffold104068_cov105-Phaeocystis_antarctica.AAC.2
MARCVRVRSLLAADHTHLSLSLSPRRTATRERLEDRACAGRCESLLRYSRSRPRSPALVELFCRDCFAV